LTPVAALTLTLLAALAAPAQQIPVAARLQDLNFVATQVPALDPYFFARLDPALFQQAADSLNAGAPSMSDAEFYTGLAQLVSMAGDTHTSLFLNDAAAIAAGFRQIPLEFRWLDDGVFVTAAADPYSQALGTQLVAVGGVPIDQVVERLATVISYENVQGLRARVEQYLPGQQILQGLHIAPVAPQTEMTFQTLAGDRFTLQVGPVSGAVMTVYPIPNQGTVPDYLQSQSLDYWYSYSPANRLLYLKYNLCADMPNYPSTAFAVDALATLDSNPAGTLVLDLRGNPGGSTAVIQALFDGLAQRFMTQAPASDFRIYVPIDKRSFSAANAAAMDMKAPPDVTGLPPGVDFSGLVQTIGEPTGEPPAMYGNVLQIALPASGMTVQYSTQYYPAPAWIPAGPLLAPDIAIAVRSTDYFARFDPVMAAILARSAGAPAAPSGDVIAVNGASFRPDQGIAPGSVAAAFGAFAALPDQVLVSGVAAQILAASASQVDLIVPATLAPGRATVSVRAAGLELATGEVTLTPTGPGIFVLQPADPSQPGAVENQDYSVNANSNPAAQGSVVQIFATGSGSGSSATQVFFGDTPAQVLFSGQVAPGLWQIDAQVPEGVTGQVSLSVAAGNLASNGVTVWVR
jgi:uncharacterized protein (TIGR03437 family)